MSRFLAVLFTVGCALTLPIIAQDSAGGSNNAVDELAVKDVNYWTGTAYRGGNSESYTGDTTGGLQWNRPFADGTCCSGLGPVTYQIEYLHVGTTGAYNVRSVQDGFDGYLFVYEGSFDPSNQTVNFVAGDDDGNGGVGTSDIEGVTLDAGTTYIIVTTGFAAGDEGTYTNTVEGPGSIAFGLATIPTLGEWGMVAFIILLAGTGIVLSRRGRIA